LYILCAGQAAAPVITAAEIGDDGGVLARLNFTRANEQAASVPFGPPQRYLYEPSPAFMKAGGFKILAAQYELVKLHPHTHLYTGDAHRPDFPGRAFEIIGVHQASRKDLPVTRANLTVRNFPQSVESLRRQWKLADGGDDYLFACTLADGGKAVLHARKVQNAA
jgi:hypothetical protein